MLGENKFGLVAARGGRVKVGETAEIESERGLTEGTPENEDEGEGVGDTTAADDNGVLFVVSALAESGEKTVPGALPSTGRGNRGETAEGNGEVVIEVLLVDIEECA